MRAFALQTGEILAARLPDDVTVAQRKKDRGRRIYFDYLRNAFGQHAVAPYSIRPLDGAPVATPLTWHEAVRHDMHPRKYSIRTMFRRLGQRDDPWREIDHAGQALGAASERLRRHHSRSSG